MSDRDYRANLRTEIGDAVNKPAWADPDGAVRGAKEFIVEHSDEIRFAPPEDALSPQQMTDYREDKQWREDLVRADGGEVSTLDGVDISEQCDPEVQAMVVDYKVRTRGAEAVKALESYERSLAIRTGYRLHSASLRVQERCSEFRGWLRR